MVCFPRSPLNQAVREAVEAVAEAKRLMHANGDHGRDARRQLLDMARILNRLCQISGELESLTPISGRDILKSAP